MQEIPRFHPPGVRRPVGRRYAAQDQSQLVLRVGKGQKYAVPSQAAAAATNGAVVEIEAGTYVGDVAVWRAHDLTLRGVGKGRVHLKANGAAADRKGTWVVTGNNITIENIEFSGSRVPDKNGAGIRHQASGLTVRNCFFHDNENGILGGGGDVLIEDSEFASNGYGDGQSHNVYISQVKSLTVRHCYLHHAKAGHNLKSRAQVNYILYNRIADEQAGTSSYAVDLPEGGLTYLVGNIIQQGAASPNRTIVAYGMEGRRNELKELYVIHNTFVNEGRAGTFVSVRGDGTTVRLVNNIFAGAGTVLAGKGDQLSNLAGVDPAFVDPVRGDYALKPNSPAIDKGTPPRAIKGFDVTPRSQYDPQTGGVPRTRRGPPDLGALEFSGRR